MTNEEKAIRISESPASIVDNFYAENAALKAQNAALKMELNKFKENGQVKTLLFNLFIGFVFLAISVVILGRYNVIFPSHSLILYTFSLYIASAFIAKVLDGIVILYKQTKH